MSIHFVAHKPAERRLRILDVAADMFLEIFKGMDASKLLFCEPIPEDARIVGLTVDEQFNTVRLYVESKDFEPVPEACAPPHWNLMVSEWYPRVERSGRLVFDVGDLNNDRLKAQTEKFIAERGQ